MFVYTILPVVQPIVQPVVQPVRQTVVSCKRGITVICAVASARCSIARSSQLLKWRRTILATKLSVITIYLLQSPAYRCCDSERLLYFTRVLSFFRPLIFRRHEADFRINFSTRRGMFWNWLRPIRVFIHALWNLKGYNIFATKARKESLAVMQTKLCRFEGLPAAPAVCGGTPIMFGMDVLA